MTTPSRKPPEEWFLQADYDMDTARYMFDGGRHFYTVFMCHLSIEKALKGLYSSRLGEEPPKIHSLVYFVEKLQLNLPPELDDFLEQLSGISVPARYPDDLRRVSREFDSRRTEEVLALSRKALAWLKLQLR